MLDLSFSQGLFLLLLDFADAQEVARGHPDCVHGFDELSLGDRQVNFFGLLFLTLFAHMRPLVQTGLLISKGGQWL